MFKYEKLRDKIVLTIWGYVGGYYLESRNLAIALDEVGRSGVKQLDLHVHTGGGDVFDGNLILNMIKGFKGRIDLYIDGVAASMGAVILTALPKEQVHIAENGFIMIHPPKWGAWGTFKQLISAAKLLRSMETNFKAKLSERLGKPADQIDAEYFDGVDHWIDADEAISLGLAGDKFTIENGAVKFSKEEATTAGVQAMINSYTKLFPTNEISNQSFLEMKQVNMTLKLKEDAPETEAVSAINALQARAELAEQKLQVFEQKEKDAKKAEAKRLLDAAQAEQRIDAENRPKWEEKFEKDHEGTSGLLASIPKRTLAKNVVESPDSKADEALLAMSWSEADKAGRTAEMRTKFPEEYKQKFKAEFGVDPK